MLYNGCIIFQVNRKWQYVIKIDYSFYFTLIYSYAIHFFECQCRVYIVALLLYKNVIWHLCRNNYAVLGFTVYSNWIENYRLVKIRVIQVKRWIVARVLDYDIRFYFIHRSIFDNTRLLMKLNNIITLENSESFIQGYKLSNTIHPKKT